MTGAKKQQNQKGASSSAISKDDDKVPKKAVVKAERVAEALAGMAANLSSGQPTTIGHPKKHAARTLPFSLSWTVHAATGKRRAPTCC